MFKSALLISTFVVAAACGVAEPQGPEFTGAVTRVVDGDSLYVRGVEPQVRLFGVDAPERDEEGFAASKRFLTELAMGKVVRCQEVDIDRYERIVGRCFFGDGREINLLMLDEPHTVEYCRFSRGFYGNC